MAFLFTKKNRTHDVQTRIVKHDDKHQAEPARPAVAPAYVTSTLRDWRREDDSFAGFNSPPGRF
ncbi:MAG TPA: hypothetical protein VMR52_05870 [Dehalococcoidia bacterium]|nr:hypothetical protein [Dehalococcoidia bacterium]